MHGGLSTKQEEHDMAISCCSDSRRDAVRRFGGRTGLDYVEVSDDQRTLHAFFLGKLPPEFAEDHAMLPGLLRIEGGSRITGIRIVDVDPHVSDDPELDDWLVVRLDRYGDHSRYALRLVDVENVDPMYASVEFSFKVGCPSDLDCKPVDACVEAPPDEPEIHYLAKDYASFKRLIEDRLALVSPAWTERHVPDLGVTLVELLAYTGDYLSYYQDAVATEAYLDTARQRISVRRHARLVDYRLHEGCNARAWVTIETSETWMPAARTLRFLGGIDPEASVPTLIGPALWAEIGATTRAAIFEPVVDAPDAVLHLRAAHNRIGFHDWGRDDCCLPKGATRATLRDAWIGEGDDRALDLSPGDVLVFREVRGARNGLESDANPQRVCAVRLTRVMPAVDPLPPGQGQGPGEDARSTPIVEIEWHPADALPFPLCLSALGPAPDCARLRDISVAFGNVVLVDHGERLPPEPLGTVPTTHDEAACVCEGTPSTTVARPARTRWRLAQMPVTHRGALPSAATPARDSVAQDPRAALAQLSLSDDGNGHWTPVFDLLSSRADDRHVVVEIDDDGSACLRFGDGELGRRPGAGTTMAAHYRIGNGRAGNVGAGAINRLLSSAEIDGIALKIDNPMAARGGTEPEPLAEARLYAPTQFRKTLLRAITADDYATIAMRDTRVQRASCELVWTGSWYEADVALDPVGRIPADEALIGDLARSLEKVRRMGHDLHVEPAVYVPIELALEVCALPGYERGAIKAALLDRFGNRRLANGELGWFHPDRLSFGDDIRLSRIVAEAMAVPGVECVRVTRLHRRFHAPNHEIENGLLPLAAHEIARLDNDPNHPEFGTLSITVGGGR
jgi:hypothetical protein